MIWAVGDVQGCFDSFMRLLEKIEFDFKKDRLWLVGDLVNRGPKSKEVLEFVYENQDSTEVVLGNHDIALLAAWWGLKKPNPSLESVLEDGRSDEWLRWLCERGFLHIDESVGYAMVHAGIAPAFDIEKASFYNEALKKRISGEGAKEWLKEIGKRRGVRFEGDETERESYALNSFIAMRFCEKDGTLNLSYKLSPSKESEKMGLYPWFECPNRKKLDLRVVFGHWSTLGYLKRDKILSLDTGCVWRRKLTAASIEKEPKVVWVDCPEGILIK